MLPNMAKKYVKLSDQIRSAIESSGVTRYRISKETGIAESVLSRFMHGHAGLQMDTLDTLGEYLKLEIVQRRTTSS